MVRAFYLFTFFFLVYYKSTSQTTFSEDSIRYYLDNRIIKIGFDKRMGGAVSYFTRISHGLNMINNHDAGRQAGFETRIYPDVRTWLPYPDTKYLTDVYPYAGGASREWNGLPQGSFYNEYIKNTQNLGGLPEKISFDANSGVLYIKSKLWEWGFVKDSAGVLVKIDAGAYNEYWISLEGITAHFSAKQTRNIPYFISSTNLGVTLHVFLNLNYAYTSRWHTYNQSHPYTNQNVNVKTDFWAGDPNYSNYWDYATENWVALTNNEDFGAGIYLKDSHLNDNNLGFLYAERQFQNGCGFAAPSCTEEEKYSFGLISISNYGFPCGEPCTKPGNTTTLNFGFMAGTVSEMREFAYNKHEKPCAQSLVFSSVNDDFGTPTTKKTSILIEADNAIKDSTTNMTSGKYILLKPGFKVQSGAVFSANVKANPCD